MINRRNFVLATGILSLSGALGASTVAFAAKPEIFSSASNIAISGFDPVAYFTKQMAVEGNASYSNNYKGAIWQFSNQENLDKFVAMPTKYAPQYGGYCAYAVSLGSTASTDPEAWTIVDGKLYLNNTIGVREIWRNDIPGNIKKADKNWPGVLQ